MGDIAWVRKYRPASFDDYMGENVKNMVVNRFKDRKNIPNTVMLYGTRGTGKTSMARLLAKEIHCMNPVDGHSCGVCDMCQEIDAYITSTEAGAECFGITEVDAAKTNGKNDINDIIEEALIPPMEPLKYKILIMDECHELSNAAQNSMLKVVEEPPPFLVFIFCTTDPQKVLPTIQSRMQMKIEVRKKTIDEMADKLNQISMSEGVKTSREALQIIAKKGGRIPRDCINLLEEVAKQNGNIVTVETVNKTLGNVSTKIYIDFFTAVNQKEKPLEGIMSFTNRLKQQDVTTKAFIIGLIRFTLDCVYIRCGVNLDDFPIDFIEPAKKLFSIYGDNDIDMMLQILEHASTEVTDDDTINELVTITMAMRIGKVQLLARGLSKVKAMAEVENKSSIVAYRQRIEEAAKHRIDNLPESTSVREAFTKQFAGITDVANSQGIIEVVTSENKQENKSDSSTFSAEDLERMMNNH